MPGSEPLFRKNVQGVSVTSNDVSGLPHFLFERGIVCGELIGVARPLDQKNAAAFNGLQPGDRFRRQTDTERFPNFANLDFEYASRFHDLTIVATLAPGRRLRAPSCSSK